MKLTTFMKAYKIALSNIGDRVKDWSNVYLGDVQFPDDDRPDRITFVFSTGHDMQPGDMGLSAALPIIAVESLKGGLNSIAKMTMDALDKDCLAREYINRKEKINDCGRVMVLLETMLERLKVMEEDRWGSAEITNIFFNFDKDLAEFIVDGMTIYTNGSLVLLGE